MPAAKDRICVFCGLKGHSRRSSRSCLQHKDNLNLKKQVANLASIEGQEEGNKGTEDAHVKNSKKK